MVNLFISQSVLKTLSNHFPEIAFDVKIIACKINITFNQKTSSFWFDDWSHKTNIVLAIINTKLGNNQRIFARNCDVQKVNKQMAETFLNENYLYGYKTAYYKYALFFQNEIIAMATFSKGRKMNRLSEEKRSFELISFCCKKNVSVVGGLSKLLKAFVNELNPGDVMTYIDKDWSNGDSYLKLGFQIHSETTPQLFFFDKENLTKYKENQLTIDLKKQEHSFETVFNTGNLKLVYTL